MAHTPGDWVVHKNEDREFGLFSIYSDHPDTCFAEVAELRLCEAGEMEPDGKGGSREFRSYHVSEEECEANARLIAAAPELLEACREAFSAIEKIISERPMSAATICGSTTLGNHRAYLKSIIAKATGKAVQP